MSALRQYLVGWTTGPGGIELDFEEAAMAGPNLSDVLAEVNRLRAEHNIGEPLAEIPKGIPGSCEDCPMGRALNGFVGMSMMWPNEQDAGRQLRSASIAIATPPVLREFIVAFDDDYYPDLLGPDPSSDGVPAHANGDAS